MEYKERFAAWHYHSHLMKRRASFCSLDYKESIKDLKKIKREGIDF
jgi:hypothetical protein